MREFFQDHPRLTVGVFVGLLPLSSTIALIAALLLLLGCATTSHPLPPRAPDAIQVLVPVTQPCKVEKVVKSPLVTERLGAGTELFEAVKRVLADRALLLSDREKLVAANSDPCPEVMK